MLHLLEFGVDRSAVKQVTCEKCGHAFEYLLNLEMKIATIPIPALMRRQALAYGKILDRRVAQEVEPVSCPSCGWMQSAMVETLRRRSFRGLKLWGALLSIASGVLAIVFLAVGIYSRFRPLGVDLDCF